MSYRYGMRLRGFSIGCQPRDGFIERMDDLTNKYCDILVYDRPLTEKELEDYELDDLNEGSKAMAKYYVVDCISGCMDGVEPFANLGDAIKQRDAWNEESKAEHDSDSFWMIVDEDGKEVV